MKKNIILTTLILAASFLKIEAQHECNIALYKRDVSQIQLLEATPGEIDDLNNFESYPGAKNVIYLDFDGEDVTSTWWTQHVAGSVINAAPTYFSTAEKLQICKAVAADFQPWEVNVTTIRKLHDDNYHRNRAHAIFTNTNFYPGSPGGVAKLGSYASVNSYAWVFQTSAERAANTASHELGHVLNLAHHGINAYEYYGGHGDWAPIMGSSSKTMAQWSKGEYMGATNTNSDYSRLNQYLTPRNDDWSSSLSTPNNLSEIMTGPTTFSSNGLISTQDDIDVFVFSTTGGNFILNFGCEDDQNRTNLRLEASILALDGTTLHRSETVSKSQYLNVFLAQGTYYLQFDGIGYLNVNTGYSDYNSMGKYQFSGTINNLSTFSDIGITNVEDLGSVTCSEKITAKVHVKNFGTENASNFDIEIKNVNGTILTKNITAVVAPMTTEVILVEFTPTNFKNFTYEAELLWPSDEISSNNKTSGGNTNYLYGENIDFEIHENVQNSYLSWEIKNKHDGATFLSSTDLGNSSFSGIYSQSFCLPKDSCFDLQVENPFKTEDDWCGDASYQQYNAWFYPPEHIFNVGDTLTAGWPAGIYRFETQMTQPEAMAVSPNSDTRFTKLSCVSSEASSQYYLFKRVADDENYAMEMNVFSPTVFNYEICTADLITSNISTGQVGKSHIMFPNPAEDVVYFQSATPIKTITLFNVMGSVVLIRNNVNEISLRQLAKGSYFVRIESDFISVEKLIID